MCQSVCPVYQATKNECAVSRGKFVLLNGIVKNELNFNDSVLKNLDLCTNCNACKDFCPSNIDAKEIFASAKNEYSKNKLLSPQQKMILTLRLIKIFLFIYRFLKLDKVISQFESKLKNKSKLIDKILFLNSLASITSTYEKKPKSKHSKGKVMFFPGCYNKYINPSSQNAALNLIEELGYEITNVKTSCCSMNSYYSGYFNEFKKNAKKNINSIPEDIKYIITDCDSCLEILKKYDEITDCNKKIESKLMNLHNFLVLNNFTKNYKEKKKITIHKPCYSKKLPAKILEGLDNVEYLPMKNPDSCCGQAGTFAIKHPEISDIILETKIKEVKESKAEYVLTSCPSCVLGLKKGLYNTEEIKVLTVSEFLNLK